MQKPKSKAEAAPNFSFLHFLPYPSKPRKLGFEDFPVFRSAHIFFFHAYLLRSDFTWCGGSFLARFHFLHFSETKNREHLTFHGSRLFFFSKRREPQSYLRTILFRSAPVSKNRPGRLRFLFRLF